MKLYIYILLLSGMLFSCSGTQKAASQTSEDLSTEQDTVRISNDNLEYEIIIIEPGFNFWLKSTARPEGYYSQDYLESRNRLYVAAWNQRAIDPYQRQLYQMQIDYQSGIDYGYDVNYQLYNYFIYFQLTYKQKLAGFVPRI